MSVREATRSIAAIALAIVLAAGSGGCVPLLTPHAEGRGTIGVAVGRTRAGEPSRARLTGTLDTVYLPTTLAGCDRDFDLGLGARFHFVEPEHGGANPTRIGGVASGTWFFVRGPFHRGELRVDLDALELDGRPLAGVSVTIGAELFGITEGAGAAASWEGILAGAWSGEAGVRIEATVAAHEDFGGVRYATFTAGLTVRWPAGAGVGVVNPIVLALAAANSGTSSSATTPATATPPPNRTSPGISSVASEPFLRGCGETSPPAGPEAGSPAPAVGAVDDVEEEGDYRCTDADGIEESVDAISVESAERACALMLGAPCTCERAASPR